MEDEGPNGVAARGGIGGGIVPVTGTERGKGSEDIAGIVTTGPMIVTVIPAAIDTGQGLHPVTESTGDGNHAQGAGTDEDMMITNDIGARITRTTTADVSFPDGDPDSMHGVGCSRECLIIRFHLSSNFQGYVK